MKLIFYNIRGLGSRLKIKEMQDLIRKNKVDFACIQETKLEELNDEKVRAIWGSYNCGWAVRDAQGRSGGILLIWNSEKFLCSSYWNMEGAVVVNGYWGVDRIRCCILNVYAPCPLEERLDLWDRLNSVIHQFEDCCLCIGGILILSEQSLREGVRMNR